MFNRQTKLYDVIQVDLGGFLLLFDLLYLCFLVSLQAMISYIMSDSMNIETVHQITRHIKIFLTYFDKMDKYMQKTIQLNKESKFTKHSK